MSSERLIRWSGLAALVGGVLLIAFDILSAALYPGEQGSEVMLEGSWFGLQIIGLVAIAVLALGLVGMYAYQAEKAGTLGLIAFVAAFFGIFMLFGLLWGEPFLGSMIAKEAPEVLDLEPSGVLAAGVIVSYVLFSLGMLLFGLATLQANLLPRVSAYLLMVGAVLFFILSLLELPFWTVFLGVAFAWMGYALWSGAGMATSSVARAAG